MTILMIITMLAAGLILFGLPIWNLAYLRNKQHVLWLITPPVLVVSLAALSQIFEGAENSFYYEIFYQGSFYTVILLLMLFGVSFLSMLIKLIFKISSSTTFWIIVMGTVLYFAAAYIHGEQLVIKKVSLQVEDISQNYRFVHISDLQNSANHVWRVQKIIDTIQSTDAEFVVITGDLIDSYFVTNQELAPFNQLDIPVFLITGNHEYYLEEGKINQVIAETNILLIDGKKVSFGDVDIIGVNELDTVSDTLAALGGIDHNRYTILLNHQPETDQVNAASRAGVDLMLSGHTHGGQIWPFVLLVQQIFPYNNGLYDIDGMNLYVNPGTGTIGPPMRLGTTSEVTLITLNPAV